jgi:hypothetical protein
MPLTVIDIVYQGGGAIIAFSDNSVGHAVWAVVDGLLTLTGLTAEQQAALADFRANNIDPTMATLDARIGATQEQIDEFSGGGGGGPLFHDDFIPFYASDTGDPVQSTSPGPGQFWPGYELGLGGGPPHALLMGEFAYNINELVEAKIAITAPSGPVTNVPLFAQISTAAHGEAMTLDAIGPAPLPLASFGQFVMYQLDILPLFLSLETGPGPNRKFEVQLINQDEGQTIFVMGLYIRWSFAEPT